MPFQCHSDASLACWALFTICHIRFAASVMSVMNIFMSVMDRPFCVMRENPAGVAVVSLESESHSSPQENSKSFWSVYLYKSVSHYIRHGASKGHICYPPLFFLRFTFNAEFFAPLHFFHCCRPQTGYYQRFMTKKNKTNFWGIVFKPASLANEALNMPI